MNIRERVARAMWVDTNHGEGGNWVAVERITQETYRSNAAVAITTFLELAVKEDWHMRPGEATEEMIVAGHAQSWAADDWPMDIYQAMLASAPKFEWDK